MAKMISLEDLNNAFSRLISDEMMDVWSASDEEYKPMVFEINGMMMMYNELKKLFEE